MKKKIYIALLLAFMSLCISMILFGCSNSSTLTEEDNQTTEDDDQLTESDDQVNPTILSVEGATIEDATINMLVDHDTDYVVLSEKVKISSGKWELYSDILGQNIIPSKIAADCDGKLKNGDNFFYIMLTDNKENLVDMYTLKIYRSYAVSVNYYDNYNKLLYKDTAYTGYEYEVAYKYSADGYDFNSWNENGTPYNKHIIWDKINLYADMSAKSYNISLNANEGTLSDSSVKVTYDSTYSFGVPERIGYTFLGWYMGNMQLTDNTGTGISVWKYTNISEATAKWKINQYSISITFNQEAGTVTGDGIYDYNSEIDLVASSPNMGYDFVGWYIDGQLISKEQIYRLRISAEDISLIAKYEVWSELKPFLFSSNERSCVINGLQDKSINTIIIPNYITEITEYAFADCTNLINILFEDNSNLNTISAYAFLNCSNIDNITLPSDLKSIGIGAFKGCSSLKKMVIPFVGSAIDGTYTHFGYIFGANKSTDNKNYIPSTLKEVEIYGNCHINTNAFYDCNSLITIKLSTNINSIGEGAFSGCSSLEYMYLPFIGNSLNETAASKSTLFGYIFGSSPYVGGLETAQYFSGATNDSYCTFYIPESLKNVEIANGNILYGAFYNCSTLETIKLPDNLTSLSPYVFAYCSAEIIWGSNTQIETIAEYTFLGYRGAKLIIPDSVTTIGAGAFWYCSNLSSITLGKNLNTIDNLAFYNGCHKLIEIYNLSKLKLSIGSTNNGYIAYNAKHIYNTLNTASCINVDNNGFIFYENISSNDHYLLGYLGSRSVITLPETISGNNYDIYAYAFYECSNLEEVIIPDSVMSIGDYAFLYCSSLQKVTIGKNVEAIGFRAFYDCDLLTEAIFTITDGWSYVTTPSSENSSPIYNTALLIPEFAATTLTTNYCNGYWQRA